jgi:hypothetical protein
MHRVIVIALESEAAILTMDGRASGENGKYFLQPK